MLFQFKKIIQSLSLKERRTFLVAAAVFIITFFLEISLVFNKSTILIPANGGSFREGVVGQPTFINPIISTNPVDQDLAFLIYPRLTTLLKDYEIQNNGRVYLLKLKENLIWDDGEALTSDDILFTLNLIQNPQTNSPLFQTWQGVVAERISALQLKISLAAPYAFFPNQLKNLLIIPKHIFDSLPPVNLKLSDYNLEPVGAGPFRFHDFSKKKNGFISQYHLTANKNYPGDKPYLKDFYFKFYQDFDSLMRDFRFRQLDGFGSLTPLDPQALNIPKTKIFYLPMTRYYAIFFNTNTQPLLKQRVVRYALTQALDKEKIFREIFPGQSWQENLSLFDKIPADWLTYAPENSRKLLESLKIPVGSLNLIVPKNDFLQRTASFIKEQWQAIGLNDIQIIEQDPTEILNRLITRDYDMILFGHILSNNLDLFPFWHSSQRFYPGLNLSVYANPKVDALLESIRQTQDPQTQQEQFDQVRQLINQDAPAIFLFSLPYVYLLNKDVKGFETNLITWPANRFNNVSNWYLKTVRVFK